MLGAGTRPLSEAIERRTLRFALAGSICEGLFNGLCSMSAYVAITAMGDWKKSEGLITSLMGMIPSVLMVLAVVYGSSGRMRKGTRLFMATAFLGRMIIGAVALVANPYIFVAVVTIQALVGAGLSPAFNQIWGANYSTRTRTKFFAINSVVGWCCTMFGALAAGLILDANDGANYVYLYPAAGVIGCLGMVFFSRIRVRYVTSGGNSRQKAPPFWSRFSLAITQTRALLKRDPDFRLYETGFFLYGVAFMMMQPVIPLLYKHDLAAKYNEFGIANVLIVHLVLMLTAPIVTRALAGKRVTVVTRMAFLILTTWPGLLMLAGWLHSIEIAYLACVVHGAGMTFIHFVWNLGPVQFAKGQSPMPYTSTHAALVGARASIGYPISFLLIMLFPDQWLPICALGTCCLVAAIVLMTVLDRRLRNRMPPPPVERDVTMTMSPIQRRAA
ncbi:MAG: MFS transporter [Planctomycetes bacterium]|nr:MFS transporter [Planctomycetota bacterium]